MLLLAAPQSANAQAATAPADEAVEANSGPALTDIVVTARRREEKLADIPIAISAMSSAGIQDRGLKTIRDVAAFTPGLFAQTDANSTSGSYNRSATTLTFRGLSVAGGGTFINGVPYGSFAMPDVSDAERVEVLKGPQAVYFGRSTYSGAVNYVTRDPSSTLKAKVDLEVANYGTVDGRATIEGPIVGDRITARASVRRYHTDGQYTNFYLGTKMGKENTTSATLAVTAKPTETLTFKLYYAYTRDDDGIAPGAAIKNGGPAPTLTCNLGGTGRNYYCGEVGSVSDLPASFISNYSLMDSYNRAELVDNARGRTDLLFNPKYLDHFGFKQDVHHASLRTDWTNDDGWAVSAMGGYSHTKQQRIGSFTTRDVSNIPNPYYVATNPIQTPYYTFVSGVQVLAEELFGELRVTTPQTSWIRATVGSSYYQQKQPGSVLYNLSPLSRGNNANVKSGNFTPALFAGVYVDPLEGLTLTFEGRYQWDKIKQQQYFPTVAPELKATSKTFSPRISVDYKITPKVMVYGTFARGYRPGGFNAALASLSATDLALVLQQAADAQIAYKAEKLDNYEAGIKGSWFDNRLRTTIALYSMNWQNGQVANGIFAVRPATATAPATTFPVSLVQNLGKVNLKGVEFEGSLAVTRELTVDGTLQYARNTIKNYVYLNGARINGQTNVNGNSLDQTPKWVWTVSPNYQAGLAGDWDWFGRLDYRHRGKVFIDPSNVAWVGARDVFNVRTGVTNKDAGVRVEVYVNNLFNDDKITAASRSNDTVYMTNPAGQVVPGVSLTLNELRLQLPEKRQIGVRVSKSF